MTGDEVIAALGLPTAARVDRRVPKSLLVENGAPTAADKRSINTGIDQTIWLAALKPTSVGIATFKDEFREYLEIAVMRMRLRDEARAPRLTELLHRAIPYPVLAVMDTPGRVILSVAHKRWSQGEAGKTVLESEPVAVELPREAEAHVQDFREALRIDRQPRDSLLTLYQGWMDAFLALQASRLTGKFWIPATREQREARRHALRQYARLQVEIERMRTTAIKEKQMARQIELNLKIKKAQAAQADAFAQL